MTTTFFTRDQLRAEMNPALGTDYGEELERIFGGEASDEDAIAVISAAQRTLGECLERGEALPYRVALDIRLSEWAAAASLAEHDGRGEPARGKMIQREIAADAGGVLGVCIGSVDPRPATSVPWIHGEIEVLPRCCNAPFRENPSPRKGTAMWPTRRPEHRSGFVKAARQRKPRAGRMARLHAERLAGNDDSAVIHDELEITFAGHPIRHRAWERWNVTSDSGAMAFVVRFVNEFRELPPRGVLRIEAKRADYSQSLFPPTEVELFREIVRDPRTRAQQPIAELLCFTQAA